MTGFIDFLKVKKNNKLFGFTLAEVLIASVVAGIVISITVPPVVRNYKNKQIAMSLKQTYDTLVDAVHLAEMRYGTNYTKWKVVTNVDFTDKYIIPFVNVKNYCSKNSPYSKTPCYYSTKYLNNTNHSTFLATSTRNVFALESGAVVAVQKSGDKKADVNIDINGKNGPNLFGKDVFWFYYNLRTTIKVNGVETEFKIGDPLVPYCAGAAYYGDYAVSSSITHSTHGCKKGAYGTACGCVIYKNNWKIPTVQEYVKMGGKSEEYPW